MALESGEDVIQAVKTQMTSNRRVMNTKNGFWTISLYGDYWEEFLCDSYSVSEVNRCLVMSDGFDRLFNEGLLSYQEVMSGKVSLDSALQILRTWEDNNRPSEIKRSDDASAILVEF